MEETDFEEDLIEDEDKHIPDDTDFSEEEHYEK